MSVASYLLGYHHRDHSADPNPRPTQMAKTTSDGREVLASGEREGMHISMHTRPRRVPCRTPRFAFMPRGRGLTKFMLKPVSFGFSRLKEADAANTSGHFALDHTSAGVCPLNVFSLGTIQHKQFAAPPCGFTYSDDGLFTPILQSQLQRLTDVTSNNGESIEDVSNHSLIWRKAEVNLMLYQRDKQSTTFDITFFKLLDEAIDPNEYQRELTGGTGNTASYIVQEAQNYWNPIVQRYTQSPATLSKPYPNLLTRSRAPVRVLKKFRVEIREKLATEDTFTKRTVKFVLTPHQVMNYDLSPNNVTIEDVTGQGDVNTDNIGRYIGSNIASYYPRTKQNIYMSIAANNYHDETEQTGWTAPSYDIAMRTTYDAVNAAT